MRLRNRIRAPAGHHGHPAEQPKPVNGPRRAGSRKTEGVPEPGPRDLDYIRLDREIRQGVDRLTQELATLQAAARAGNLYALLRLRKVWGLRLPEVEAKYGVDLSGLRKFA